MSIFAWIQVAFFGICAAILIVLGFKAYKTLSNIDDVMEQYKEDYNDNNK